MKRHKSLAQLHKSISKNLLEAIRLLEILDIILDGEAKECTLTSILSNKITYAFNDISKCRNIISDED